MSNISDPIARGIKKIIADRGLVQAAVATRAGFTPQQLTDVLHGRKILRALDLFRIANALGVSVQEIYDAGAAEE